jgi:hypothetical protein
MLGVIGRWSASRLSLTTKFERNQPADEMICWPVSAAVGNVRNNNPGLIEPIAAAA